MKTVLYFHGFASSPSSAKITALRPLLEPRGIELVAPDLNVPAFERLDWEAMVDLGVEEARRTSPAAMVGSSLGALLALAVAQRGVAVPMVLIAPALGVVRYWEEHIPPGDPVTVFNYARGADAPVHRAFFRQMTDVRLDDQPPLAPVTVIMGRLDETVPFDVVRQTWDRWNLGPPSRFIEIGAGDHQLVNEAELIADAIVEAAG